MGAVLAMWLRGSLVLHVLEPLVLPAQRFCMGSTSSPIHVTWCLFFRTN
jgi:hypothetical protein